MREHHVRMNMYIAQAKNGRFEIVESLGAIDGAVRRGVRPRTYGLVSPVR